MCIRDSLEIIVHTILGLPGESEKEVLQTMDAINALPVNGIKLQLLHVLRGTDLASDYEKGLFQLLSRDAYLDLVINCLEHLRPDLVLSLIHIFFSTNHFPPWTPSPRAVCTAGT